MNDWKSAVFDVVCHSSWSSCHPINRGSDPIIYNYMDFSACPFIFCRAVCGICLHVVSIPPGPCDGTGPRLGGKMEISGRSTPTPGMNVKMLVRNAPTPGWNMKMLGWNISNPPVGT